MNLYQEVNNYVYQILDPLNSEEIVYIGKGSGGRAWLVFRAGQKQLSEFLSNLNSIGYLPIDYVEIIARNLSKKEAFSIEAELITKFKPKFNFLGITSKAVILSRDQIEESKKLREGGMSYFEISKKLNISTMTIYRAINDKTKTYLND